MGVTAGRNHDNLVFEEGEVLRTDCPAVHQSFDQLVMRPAARHLEHARVSGQTSSQNNDEARRERACECVRSTIAFLRVRGTQVWTGEDGRAGPGADAGVRPLPPKLQ